MLKYFLCRMPKMTKSNSADAFRLQFNMMQLSGVWPQETPNIVHIIKIIITWILGIALSISMIMECYNDITDITKLSEILYVMMSVTIYMIKLAAFTAQKKNFLNMVDFLKNPVFLSYPENLDHYMAKTIRISTRLANLYRYLCLCCIVMFAVYPLFDKKSLPFPFPYDVGRYRYVMYVFQIVAVSTAAWNNSCLDTLCTSLMGIGAAQLDILMEKIAHIGEDDAKFEENKDAEEQRIIEELKQCIEHHIAIMKFIEYIERVFTAGLLAQFMASVLVICNTLFQFVLIPRSSFQFVMLLNYCAIMVTQLWVYSWYGNEVIRKSVRVGEACYLSKWFNHSGAIGKYLFIIMECSKRPLALTALKFSKLSLTAFTSILQWSYSYLALLMKMYNKKFSGHPA